MSPLRKWKLNEIEAEFRAQIELAKKCVKNVTHISTHMGSSNWNKEVDEMTQKLAKEYGLYMENPQTAQFPRMTANRKNTYEERIVAFIEALGKLEPGNTYVFVEHPAYDTPEMRTVGHVGYEDVATDREGVTRMFTDERVKNFIKTKGIKLIGYNDVRK